MSKRVAMLVSNPCDPDYRVVKQAETLARAGYEVRIFATWRPKLGIPIIETINGVSYERYEWNVAKLLQMVLLGVPKYREVPRINRKANLSLIKIRKHNKNEGAE